MIRQKIQCDPDSMDNLHRTYGWIPGREFVRPTVNDKERKHNYITNMLDRYSSLQDFVLHRFFGLKCIAEGDWTTSKLRVVDTEIAAARAKITPNERHHQYRFMPNEFSYQVPPGTNHYVIWFLLTGSEKSNSIEHSPLTDEEITDCIEEAIQTLVHPTDSTFSFVWYLNPKPTIVSDVLYHAQVFWIP